MHVIWDWNGTLLDDTAACVETLNLMLAKRGLKTVTLEFFREHFAFPARQFYNLVGMSVPDSEWDALAKEYHAIYASRSSLRLNRETRVALEAVKRRGWRQSLLSALKQELLAADLERYALTDYFTHIVGSDNYDGAGKLERARRFADELQGEELLVIGDSLHDAEVAAAIGAKCHLVATGGHAFHRLAAVAPTFQNLLSALE